LGDVLNQLGISGTLLLSQIVNFLLIMIVLRLFLYEPVLNMLNKRKERVASSMKEAERAANAAAAAQKEREAILDEARREAQEVRAQATREADKIGQEVRARAEQDAADIRMKAQAEAQAQTEEVLADAQKQIAELAILATEQILGRELQGKADHERFVTEFLAQQSGSGK
jgi:F-type H+-transporting ATPase subunit b